MSHIDWSMGVWYPQGGIHEIPLALQRIGQKHGAKYFVNSPVERILTGRGATNGQVSVRGVRLQSGEELKADLVISDASIHHTDSKLLPPSLRTFSESYWDRRTLAPSAHILYLGVRGEIPDLAHHNLLFCPDWKENFGQIFDNPQWPTDPSLYVCAPSKTDSTTAPPGHENLFVLVPVAPGLDCSNGQLEAYTAQTLATIEREMNIPDLRQRIVYQRTFSIPDFQSRYNTLKGTALGLAHTMNQTAILRPNNKSKKVQNLFYAGANTNPGIGMPICLISAELAYKRIIGDRSAEHLSRL